jgi:hypothetical protein
MRPLIRFMALSALSLLGSTQALACACGCGVFSVGTSALLPESGMHGTAYLEYDYLNQTENWSGTSSAPAAANDDKNIRSDFYTAGLQYMFDKDWGISVAVPYTDRLFITEDGGTLSAPKHGALGDVRVLGMYTGFSGDLSTGIMFGLKFANGDSTFPGFDRDTAIGTGTTNLLLGAYHQAGLDAENLWTGFVQLHYDWALAEHDGYRPGNELDAAAGVYYSGWEFGAKTTLAPVLQALVSDRRRDTGVDSANGDSGYLRVLAAPGLELDMGKARLYADIEFPLYQDVNGNQLVAPRQYKLILSYSF